MEYSMFYVSNSGINIPEITLRNVLYSRMEFHLLGITEKYKYSSPKFF